MLSKVYAFVHNARCEEAATPGHFFGAAIRLGSTIRLHEDQESGDGVREGSRRTPMLGNFLEFRHVVAIVLVPSR